MTAVCNIFRQCVAAIRDNVLIEREGQKDKEFHFQNWFKSRLDELEEPHEESGRNTYPDFKLANHAEGYELKGLACPGRDANFDCNSQPPCGKHDGRQIFYVFGRYPAKSDDSRYPVLDLVICHGDFLNANNLYEHKNTSFRGLGSYGDILVRDRKMYVAPTPFALAEGVANHRTLILPKHILADDDFVKIGELTRYDTDSMIASYKFDLQSNELKTGITPNPNAGKPHVFIAYRLNGDPLTPIRLVMNSSA